LRDDIGRLPFLVSWRSVTARSKSDEAIYLLMDWFAKSSSANMLSALIARACTSMIDIAGLDCSGDSANDQHERYADNATEHDIGRPQVRSRAGCT
jgi:hypothetical protein